MEVELDLRKSARQNLEAFYEEAKWAKGKFAAAQVAAAETERQLRELEQKSAEEQNKPAAKPKRKVKGEWYEKFRWLLTLDGFLVVGGRDATQNDMLFKKHVSPGDVVLHADIKGAPLTIIKAGGNEVPLDAIKEAAVLAACYSSAWKAGFGAVDVYWVKPEQVSKEAKAGEFLGKGAFMIRGTKNWLRKTELKLAIGVAIEKQAVKVFAGSPQSLEKSTKLFIALKPGQLTQAQAAKEVLKRLLAKAAEEEKVALSQLAADDFQKLVPAGGSTVL
jgi:predicted ribosome quality control (RQC) complex YloA/Tae2 family protein